MNKPYILFITSLLLFILSHSVYAQPRSGEFIEANVGLGLCAPYDETDLPGSGFFAQAEYVWSPSTWFGVRPYAGLIIASGDSDKVGMESYKIKSNAALLGAKVRIAAPIPYVAPFIESGIGMSIGSFETYTPDTSLKKSGALLHIPLTIGLAIGRNHNYEVKFSYYYHNEVQQYAGAAALGFSFPLQ